MGGPRASQILEVKIGLARGAVGEVYRRFWERPDAARLFLELQLRTYDLARASIPLMEAALAQCEARARGDAVAAGLTGFLRRHIEEERHHPEWLLEDLEHLGTTRDQVLARPPALTAARVVGAQYYWIFHDHPIALVGYMAALEGGVASEGVLEDFITRTGLRREGFRTLLLHARVDPQHEADLDDLVDRLPLTPRHAAAIGTSAVSTISSLAMLTREVLDHADERIAAGTELSRP